jgi:hypothetical protein
MDAMHFDRLARSLKDTSSRRDLLRGAAITAVGLVTLQFHGEAKAKKRHKHKKRCRKLGQSCSPRGKRKCCKRAGVICNDFSLDRFRCCKADGEPCTVNSECCANECELGVCTPS